MVSDGKTDDLGGSARPRPTLLSNALHESGDPELAPAFASYFNTHGAIHNETDGAQFPNSSRSLPSTSRHVRWDTMSCKVKLRRYTVGCCRANS